MKKNILGLVLAGTVLLGTTSTFASGYNVKYVRAANTKVSLEQAKKIALNDAKGGTLVKAKLDRENGVLVYEVDIVKGNQKFEYDIDASTGKIVKKEVKNLNINNNNNTNGKISLEQAKKIALDDAKGGTVVKAKLDRENGVLVYEVDIVKGNQKFEYDINATTGRIVKKEVKNLNINNNNNTNGKISLEQAKQIAMSHAKSGRVTKAKLDWEKGVLVYEVEIKGNGLEKEYKIDAHTGKILDYEVEVDD